jgi:predicted phage-related endonuclease
VFAEKTGALARKPPGFAAKLGMLCEPVVLQLYVESTGATLTYPGSIKHPSLPIGATPDAIADGRTVVEAKTRNPWQMSEFGEEGTDQVPSHYFLQTQMQMHLTGLSEAHMPVLFGLQEFRIYKIQYDAELVENLVEIACRFWRDHVETGVPPVVDASPACEQWLTKRHPRPVRPVLQADAGAVELARKVQQLEKLAKSCWQKYEQAKNEMRALIGDAHGLEGPGFRVSWRADRNGQRSLRFNWE